MLVFLKEFQFLENSILFSKFGLFSRKFPTDMAKRIRLSSNVFRALYKEIINKVRAKIQDPNKERLSDNAIWHWKNEKNENLFKSMLIEERLIDSKDKFAINYLPKMLSSSKNKQIVTFGTEPYSSIFPKFCGYRDIDEFIRSMVDQGKLDVQEKQDHYKRDKNNTFFPSTKSIEKLVDSYFINSHWWLYFYGYEKFKRKNNKPYSLVRLVFSIKERNSIDRNKVDIYIQNTTHHAEHIDYTGYIDLEYCSEGILVCNLKTIREAKQLHLKFHLDKTGQELYLGQYLNYGEYNEIISGSVILHKIPEEEYEFAKPATFRFNEKQILNVPEQIVKYFLDRDLNFRKTPTSIFSLDKLKAWKDDYDLTRGKDKGQQKDLPFE